MCHVEIDGVRFDAIGTRRLPPTADHFGVRKSEWMIERYRELADEFSAANIVELGIDQGASTAMLALVFHPHRLAAFDVAPGPSEALDSLIERRSMTETVRLFWDVDQSDTDRLRSLIAEVFGGDDLDIVIDDASHLLGPTTDSFELLFPMVRPGGLFIIEDWSHDHTSDRGVGDVLRRGDAAADALEARISERLAAGDRPPVPLSHLVLELVVAAAYAPEVIADVRLRSGWCEVRRGPAALDSTFALRTHLGAIGCGVVPDACTRE